MKAAIRYLTKHKRPRSEVANYVQSATAWPTMRNISFTDSVHRDFCSCSFGQGTKKRREGEEVEGGRSEHKVP